MKAGCVACWAAVAAVVVVWRVLMQLAAIIAWSVHQGQQLRQDCLLPRMVENNPSVAELWVIHHHS
jgi:hypothetical protein